MSGTGPEEAKTTGQSNLPRSLHAVAGLLFAAMLFAYGMWSFPIAMLGPGHDRIPGDMGDARFNNYVLEHFHLYVTGTEKHYWDAPFMHPWPQTIALSDNLLGTAPVYSAFRSAGWGRESAFQLWILVLFALNFWCTLFALRAFTNHHVLAACGAFFFAFGIYGVAQMGNVQVLPRFMLPVALAFLWRWLSTGHSKLLLLAIVAITYQFYCGIYLGFLLLFASGFLMLGHALVFRRQAPWLGPRAIVAASLAAILLLALLAPLMIPYARVAGTLGTRSFAEAASSVPRPLSYFFAHPAALSWRDLSEHGMHRFNEWWCHYLFAGAVPWAAVLCIPWLLLDRRRAMEERKALAVAATAWLMMTLSAMDFGGFTLWRLFHALPGFSALRSMDRMVHVEALYFTILLVLVAAMFMRYRRGRVALSVALPVLLVLDNRIDPEAIKHFGKQEAAAKVDRVAHDIQEQYDHRADAIAWCPVMPVTVVEVAHERVIEENLTAMLAAQQEGVPIVNGYSGSYPGNFIDFFSQLDRPTLADWCSFSGCDLSRIQCIDNVNADIESMERVALLSDDGLFLCADLNKGGIIMADREWAGAWESFVLIHLQRGKCVLLAHNGMFVGAELLKDRGLAADVPDPGDFAMFTMEEMPDGRLTMQADNDRYVAVDHESRRLVARADSSGQGTWFSRAALPACCR